MKSNLMLKQFKKNIQFGTMNMFDLKTFFGGKGIFTEELVNINDDSIQFSQVDVVGKNNGYQYYEVSKIPIEWEAKYSENLSDLKNNNHTISLVSQTTSDMIYNTRWKIQINADQIFKDYMFFRLKESRMFNSINYNEVSKQDINDAIYDYINLNIKRKYSLESITFYAKYYDVKHDSNIEKNILLQYNPQFDVEINDLKNRVRNFNIESYDKFNFKTIKINYYQTKPSNQYSFNYYYNLKFKKILSKNRIESVAYDSIDNLSL